MAKYFKTATPPTSREYIPRGAEQALDAMRDGAKKFSFDIPPRSGKSNLIYLIAIEAFKCYGVFYTIVISPWVFLRQQICDAEKINSHIALYNVTENIITSELESLSNSSFWDIEDKDTRPNIWSMTLSMVYNQMASLKEAIEKTPGKVIVFFDEAHILGDMKMMGGVYDMLLEMDNVFLVSLTGTFYRRDNGIIKGSNLEIVPSKCRENGERTMRRRLDDNYVVETDYTGVNTTVYKQSADFTVSWREAWDQGALAKINGLWIDHEVDNKSIATLKPADIIPGTLREIIESPQCVDEFAKYIVEELHEAKKHSEKTERAAGMVVVGSDVANKHGEKEANRHARQVKDAITRIAKERGYMWDIEIITMTEDGSGSGTERMEAFRNEGRYDIVIVKMMGLVGLDVDRLKVLALLSTLRDGPMLAQALTRPLTVWKDSDGLVPRVIMLADPYMRASFAKFIASQGGLASRTEMTKAEERIVEDKKKDNSQDIGDTLGVWAHQDHTLAEAEGDYLSDIHVIRRKYPHSTRNRTDVEILGGINEGAYPLTDADRIDARKEEKKEAQRPKAVNINAMLSEKCEAFNQLTKDYANLVHSYASQPERWVMARTEIARAAKNSAGIVVEIQHERDIAKLRAAIEFVTNENRRIMLSRVRANG